MLSSWAPYSPIVVDVRFVRFGDWRRGRQITIHTIHDRWIMTLEHGYQWICFHHSWPIFSLCIIIRWHHGSLQPHIATANNRLLADISTREHKRPLTFLVQDLSKSEVHRKDPRNDNYAFFLSVFLSLKGRGDIVQIKNYLLEVEQLDRLKDPLNTAAMMLLIVLSSCLPLSSRNRQW